SATPGSNVVNVSASERFRRAPPETQRSSSSRARTPSISGTAVISAATPDARASSWTCPSSPNPVTSVSADARAATAYRHATSFKVVITATAASTGAANSRLHAVDTAPAPSGLVSTSASPTRPPALVSTAAGSTTPVTASPYFGSGSSIECPPTTEQP